LRDGRVLVVGGQDSVTVLATSELYDPGTGQWARIDPMNIHRVNFTLTLLANGKVLAAGGRSEFESGLLDSTELFDPATGHWTSTGSLLAPREGAVATLLANGRVLVCGGDQPDNSIVASAELYDPLSGKWSATGRMSNAREDFSATLLANGKVLVAGGFGVEDLPTNVELYDPGTGVWVPTIPLITGREGHSAFRLADGKVVIVGGFNFNDVDHSATAEVYDPASAMTPSPILLTDAVRLPTGAFRFSFNNTPGLKFEVSVVPDPTRPSGLWTDLGEANEVFPGNYEFTDDSATNGLRMFYRVRF